jgi:hypothetical protein
MSFYLWVALGGVVITFCAGFVAWYCSDGAVKRREHQDLQDQRIAAAFRLLAEDQLD